MPNREQQILALLREDPMLPQQAIAERLGISRSAVAGQIRNLTGKGLIRGRAYVLGDPQFVVSIGGANIDIHGKSRDALRPKDSNPGRVMTSAGGVARNVAENLARLGIDSRLVSAIGNDSHGDLLLQLSRDAGVDMQYVQQFSSASTSSYLSVLDRAGDMQVAISDMDVMQKLDARRLQSIRAMLRQASLLIIDTNLSTEALAWIADNCSSQTIFADTVSTSKAPRLRPVLHAIHTLQSGASEAESLTGLPARTDAQLKHIAKALHDEGVKRVFVTRGKRGAFYSDGNSMASIRQKTLRTVRNAGGAGDAFLAGLAYTWLENRSVEESARFALAAAQLTVAHSATSSPALTLAAVQQQLGASDA